MNKESTPTSVKKNLFKKPSFVISLGLLILAILWLTLTLIVPLVKGDGASNYSGTKKELAQRIVTLTQEFNGPQSPSFTPDFMYHVHVDDIRPVSAEEVSKFCIHPSLTSSDPSDFHYYAATVTEGYLLSLKTITTHHVGCNVTDYLHSSIFGDPKGKVYDVIPQ